jgi:antitoxin ChpS
MTLTAEMLAILDVKEGDSLYVVRSDDGGLRILAHDPEVVAALKAADIVMDENRDLLAALAGAALSKEPAGMPGPDPTGPGQDPSFGRRQRRRAVAGRNLREADCNSHRLRRARHPIQGRHAPRPF